MKNTATKAKTEDTNNTALRTKPASKAFAENTQHKSNLRLQQRYPLRQRQSVVALHTKAATGYGNALFLKKKTHA